MSRTRRVSWRTTWAVQNFAVAVCAAVRCVLESWPTALISLNPATHSALPRAGGGGGRKRAALGRRDGSIVPAHGVCGARYAGGVRRHTPGPGVLVGNDDVDPIGVRRPSPVRRAMMFVAA